MIFSKVDNMGCLWNRVNWWFLLNLRVIGGPIREAIKGILPRATQIKSCNYSELLILLDFI